MAFINEYISPEDVQTYGLEAIDALHDGTHARDWTVDRDRNIYLRNVLNGRYEERNQTLWTFYWKGTALTLRLDLLAGGGRRGEPGWTHWRLVHLNGSRGLPLELKRHRTEIIEDLKQALNAYKGFGIFSNNTDYSITLDGAEDIVR